MSAALSPTVPDLLTAARSALHMLGVLASSHGSPTRDDWRKSADDLHAALEAFEVQSKEREAKLPLSPADMALNFLLKKEMGMIRRREWIEARRELWNEFLTASYTSLSWESYCEIPSYISIWGAERPKELTQRLGGKWYKKAGGGSSETDRPHWDYVCDHIPDGGFPVQIYHAEPRATKQEECLEL